MLPEVESGTMFLTFGQEKLCFGTVAMVGIIGFELLLQEKTEFFGGFLVLFGMVEAFATAEAGQPVNDLYSQGTADGAVEIHSSAFPLIF
jgi:hypothetical protein